jgi:hypothetical protein
VGLSGTPFAVSIGATLVAIIVFLVVLFYLWWRIEAEKGLKVQRMRMLGGVSGRCANWQ